MVWGMDLIVSFFKLYLCFKWLASCPTTIYEEVSLCLMTWVLSLSHAKFPDVREFIYRLTHSIGLFFYWCTRAINYALNSCKLLINIPTPHSWVSCQLSAWWHHEIITIQPFVTYKNLHFVICRASSPLLADPRRTTEILAKWALECSPHF